MRDLIYRYRLLFLLAILIGLGSLTVLSHQPSSATGRRRGAEWSDAILDLALPVQRVLTAPVRLVEGLWDRYLALVSVRDENERLRSRIAALADENLQLREALLATDRLEAVLATQQEVGLPMLPAVVVGQDPSLWFHSAVLDRGRLHGVLRGMPVLTDEGVAGVVSAASEHASRAMLLLDRQTALDGLVQRSRTRGIVRGTGSDWLQFEYDAREPALEVGDVVITSGIGGVHPKGLRIGEIVSVDSAGRGLLQQARIRPAVNFSRLEQAYVLLWRSPALELLDEMSEDRLEAAAAATRGTRVAEGHPSAAEATPR